MSTKSSFRELLERRDATQVESPKSSGSPAVKLMLTAGNIRQPIDVARLFRRYGMSLRKAHDTLTRLARRNAVAAEFCADDLSQLISQLSGVGVKADPIQIPDIDVRRVRDRFSLSQADFALQFGLEVDTIRNWEQGRNAPDPSARLLLKIIDSCPEVIEAALTSREPREYLFGTALYLRSYDQNRSYAFGLSFQKEEARNIAQEQSIFPVASAIQPRAQQVVQLEAEEKRLRDPLFFFAIYPNRRQYNPPEAFGSTPSFVGVQAPQRRAI